MNADGYNEAWRWTAETGFTALGYLPSIGGFRRSIATTVSADGQTIAGTSTGTGGGSTRWTEAIEWVGLGFGGAAIDISSDGSVIVGVSGEEAYYWTQQSGKVSLGDLPGGEFRSEARAVSADGSVIVGRVWTDKGAEAFIWDATNGMRNLQDVLTGYGLDLTGWQLDNYHFGISDDGMTIVGGGKHFSNYEAWVAHIPEPASMTLLMLSGLILSRRQRKR